MNLLLPCLLLHLSYRIVARLIELFHFHPILVDILDRWRKPMMMVRCRWLVVLTVDPHVGASPANGNGSLTPRRSFLLHEGSTLGPIELGTTETCFIPTRLQPTLSCCCWRVAISCNNIHRHWETSGAKLNRTLAHTLTRTLYRGREIHLGTLYTWQW